MACGVPVLSDYVDIIEKLFGDSVLFYTNEEQFVEQYYPDEPGDVKWSFFAKSQQLRV